MIDREGSIVREGRPSLFSLSSFIPGFPYEVEFLDVKAFSVFVRLTHCLTARPALLSPRAFLFHRTIECARYHGYLDILLPQIVFLRLCKRAC